MKLLLIVLLLLCGSIMAQEIPVIPIGSHSVQINERATTQHPLTFTETGATFVKVYFEPIGQAEITVRNADGSESYTYTPAKMGKHTKHKDGVWAALSVNGDTAVVEVRRGSVMVTKVDYGLAEPIMPETTCGLDNKVWIACHDATVRDRSRPVARLNMATGGMCTAWRVGPGNMMLTNNHCVSIDADIAGAEVWFDFEYADCAGTIAKTPFKLVGGTLLSTSKEYDYSLFTVEGTEAELQPFGYFGLETRPGVQGERIYMVGHPGAARKKGMVQSDLNASGFCEIDALNRNGYATNSDYGYWCDSEGGQSGSPVLTPTNNRAIALHHFGGCMNQGVKISHVWAGIASFFNGVPPVGDGETPPPPGSTLIANINFDCVDNVCQYSAQGSDGNAWSWDFADGTTSNLFSGTKTYTVPNTYTVRLFVTDGTNYNATSKTITVNVPGYNYPPVAQFTWTIDGLTVHFKSTSYDPEGSALTYGWKMRDPLDNVLYSYSTAEVDHTYVGPGPSKYAHLRVYDDKGAGSNVRYTYFTLPEPPPPPPVCGDGVCNGTETWQTCPADCPKPPDPITLTYTAKKVHGPNWNITYKWSGAVGDTVKLYRSSTPTTTANDGSEMYPAHNRDKGFSAKVCDATQCSRTITVTW